MEQIIVTASSNNELQSLLRAVQLASPNFEINGCKLCYSTSPPKKLVAILYATDTGEPVLNVQISVFSSEISSEVDNAVNTSGITFTQETISCDYDGQVYACLVIGTVVS